MNPFLFFFVFFFFSSFFILGRQEFVFIFLPERAPRRTSPAPDPPLRRTAQNFALSSLSRRKFRSLFSLWVFSSEKPKRALCAARGQKERRRSGICDGRGKKARNFGPPSSGPPALRAHTSTLPTLLMCVTVRTLCLLVSSVSVILSVCTSSHP